MEKLLTKRHINYFKQCLGILPVQFQSEDSDMVAVAYYSLVGLDLLGGLNKVFTKKDISQFIDWFYAHAVETDKYYGFRGSMSYKGNGKLYDPPSLAATFFSLMCLIILGDDLQRINRIKTMKYVISCQLSNGSFTQILDMSSGKPLGDVDSRFCMMASAIRRVLKWRNMNEDINIDKLEHYIKTLKIFDGGFGMSSFTESHTGLIFCALDTLKMIDRFPNEVFQDTLDFLVHRQVYYGKYNQTEVQESQFADTSDNGGFNGRLNKYADTCYAFWTIGSLKLMGYQDLVDSTMCQRYLLNQTQNTMIGGFTKTNDPDDTIPDPLHSCLGIATLSILGNNSLDELNEEFVISKRAYKHWMSITY